MKTKIVIIILAVISLGLAIALFATKKQGEDQHTADLSSINVFSNQLVEASDHAKDLSQANLALTNDLALSRQQAAELSNSLVSAHETLQSTMSTLEVTQSQITNLNLHIAELETQNKVLDQRAETLSATIAQLNVTIENTRAQLAQSDANNAFLQSELQKQLAQKAELEHKFNDITEVRAQVKKMADEMYVARRIQLMKYDTGGKKGAELLTKRSLMPESSTPKAPSNYDLNVEVGSDGSIKVIPPIGATNPPAQ